MKAHPCSRIFPGPSLASAALLALAANAATAQSQSGEHFVHDPLGVAGPFTTVVAGDLDFNLSPEVAAIRDGSLIVFHDPDVNDASVVVATGVRDVCYYPNANGTGKPGLLYTTATELRVASFDSTTSQYETHVVSSSPLEMQGAKLLRYANEAGVDKIFFVNGVPGDIQTPQRIYSAVANGTGFSAVTTIFTLTQTVRDLVLLYYADGTFNGQPDVGLDVGILHSSGFTIRSQHGVSYVSRSAVADAIAVVHRAGFSDALALVAHLAGQCAVLLYAPDLAGQDPTYNYPTVLLGSISYGSAASADTNGDGLDDLALGNALGRIDVLTQDPSYSSRWYGNAIRYPIDMTVPNHPESEMGRILWQNLFNDRDSNGMLIPSFAAPLPSINGLSLLPGIGARPGLGVTASDFDRVRYLSGLYPCGNTAVTSWATTLGSGWGAPSGANAVEVIVRRQRSGAQDPDNTVFHHMRFGLTGGTIAGTEVAFDLSSTHDGADINPAEGSDEKYFIQVRPIQVSPAPGPGLVPTSSTTQMAWRWSVLSMSADCCALDQLRHLQWHLLPEVPICDHNTCDPTVLACSPQNCDNSDDVLSCEQPPNGGLLLGPGKLISSAVPQSRVPNSGPGTLPIIFPPNY